MAKLTKYVSIIVLLCTLSVAVFVYKNIEIESEIPPKPTSIPTGSLWVGGLDGGVYILLNKLAQDKLTIYDAKIFYSEGTVSYIGKLVINTPENPSFDYADISFYTGWDGDTLYLKDGRTLSIYNKK